MRLFEYEGKKILKDYGLKIPKGEIVTTPTEAEAVAKYLGGRVAIKSQVLVGGRGKAGGVQFADNPEKAKKIAASLLGSTLKGEVIKKLLVEECLKIRQEYYLGLTIDPVAGQPLLMFSREGGVDIEEVNIRTPEKIGRMLINVCEGLHPYSGRQLARQMGITGKALIDIGLATAGLYQAFRDFDAIIAEINPLVLTEEGLLIAADSKFELDDDALYRHPDFTVNDRIEGETDLEKRARQLGIKYVELDGNIGIAGNGAGLMMTTVDMVERFGGKAANFVDGGGAGAKGGSGEGAINWWDNIIQLVLANPKVKVLLFNMLSGNNRGDEVAQGLIRGLRNSRSVPVVIRLSGTRQEEGRAILRQAGYTSYDSMEEAIQAAVTLAQEVD
ncbi:Succinyl-CoA synthetase, beta subunit [Moorella glycerini]|uniref:Succinyl-CoA ligase [ADP-forming] subunit beta n=1 Tax=Neomoorella stamsii TaxID=1266720 RepID=A0A9X7P7C3_9FIRM|nr:MULTISPECIES: ADP-forming succinate--CoA ligase subunit beta [Moorella]PRR76420.1 Succinyl-CoA ligase [ADP-forming] subunit beta [Moorella stamsii]CEP67011.1 Succinyl-CoA synthetase, beta subunit [Moorella glycerini]